MSLKNVNNNHLILINWRLCRSKLIKINYNTKFVNNFYKILYLFTFNK